MENKEIVIQLGKFLGALQARKFSSQQHIEILQAMSKSSNKLKVLHEGMAILENAKSEQEAYQQIMEMKVD